MTKKRRLHWAERLLQISFLIWGVYSLYLQFFPPDCRPFEPQGTLLLIGLFNLVGLFLFFGLVILGLYYSLSCLGIGLAMGSKTLHCKKFRTFMSWSLIISLFLFCWGIKSLLKDGYFSFQLFVLPLLWTLSTMILKSFCPKPR